MLIKPLQNELVQQYNKSVKDFFSQESVLKTKCEQDIKKYLRKYEELVNIKPFEDKHNELIKLVEEKYQSRVKQLITWIRDSNFYTTVYKDIDGNALYDFDNDNSPELQKLEEKFEKKL
ncbi:hypothetical protein [Gilliamella sp. Occ3-1]|uniref:hypothetical protein n=1 Tax=unclassified Gilliamella TaxID=2685620 RepID=UPI00080DE5E6|nr:hypothetical protein [Gilliamella apicola]OCG71543.1 hypothetical protein A9G43_05585 [Gilliamella apicola]